MDGKGVFMPNITNIVICDFFRMSEVIFPRCIL